MRDKHYGEYGNWGKRVWLCDEKPTSERQLPVSQTWMLHWGAWTPPHRPPGSRKVCGAPESGCSSQVLFSKSQCPSEWPSWSFPGSAAPAKEGDSHTKERSYLPRRSLQGPKPEETLEIRKITFTGEKNGRSSAIKSNERHTSTDNT